MEAKPRPCTLEITLISGENISVDPSSLSENVYVVARAESLNCHKTKMVNRNSGFHAWNETFRLEIPKYARSVTFEVQCDKYKDVRPIGVARIALSDLLSTNKNNASESVPEMLCYSLRNWEGHRNGVIHFSVREVTAENNLCSETKQEKEKDMISSIVSCRGFDRQVMVDARNPSQVVTGIPVWWSFQSATI